MGVETGLQLVSSTNCELGMAIREGALAAQNEMTLLLRRLYSCVEVEA